jgi:hypothetical protein
LGAVCPAGFVAQLAQIPWRITVLCPTGTETDLGRLFEAAIEDIPSDNLAPKGGVGIKQIARMERNTVIAAPGRKPEFTSAARLFSYQRLHEISSGK